MTVTISRLYDNYADAQKAVQGLEAAASRIRKSASSPTTRTAGTAPTRRSIVTATASTIVPKVPAGAGIGADSVARQVCWLDLGCSRSPAWARWSRPDGSQQRRSVRQRVLRRAESSER